MTVAALLTSLLGLSAGSATGIVIGVGIAAVALVAWALYSGATEALLMAVLLIVAGFAGSIAFGGGEPVWVPVAAAGLYLLVELAVGSLEVTGRHEGWRSFRRVDALRILGGAAVVAALAWLVPVAGRGIDLPGGIFIHTAAVAAIAVVIGVIGLLVGRDEAAGSARNARR